MFGKKKTQTIVPRILCMKMRNGTDKSWNEVVAVIRHIHELEIITAYGLHDFVESSQYTSYWYVSEDNQEIYQDHLR